MCDPLGDVAQRRKIAHAAGADDEEVDAARDLGERIDRRERRRPQCLSDRESFLTDRVSAPRDQDLQGSIESLRELVGGGACVRRARRPVVPDCDHPRKQRLLVTLPGD